MIKKIIFSSMFLSLLLVGCKKNSLEDTVKQHHCSNDNVVMRNNWNGGYDLLLDKNTCNGFLMFQKQYTGNNIYQTTLTLRHKDWPKYESKYEEIIINDSQDKSKQIYVHSGVSDNVCLMSIFNQNEQSISIYQGNTDCYANVGARASFKKKLFVGDNGYNEELKYINDSILEANFQMESDMKYAQTITN